MRSPWWDGDAPITQDYGCTDFAEEGPSPFHPECPYFHEGIDVGLDCGVQLFSGVVGQVVQVGARGYGPFSLTIRSGAWDIWLGHLELDDVALGQQVLYRQPLGLVGAEGFAFGCHLHFEVRPAGEPYRHSVDPEGWLGPAAPLAALQFWWAGDYYWPESPMSPEELVAAVEQLQVRQGDVLGWINAADAAGGRPVAQAIPDLLGFANDIRPRVEALEQRVGK